MRAGCVLLVAGSVWTGGNGAARAESLDAVLPYVVDNHDRVRAAKARLTAARNRAREALGDWYPTLGQTGNFGHENQNNASGTADTSTGFHEYDLSLTQLLWDFGSTNASIDKARLRVEEARFGLIEARQGLILEAITAYMEVLRAQSSLEFAKDSEERIREQGGIEEQLVDLGSGFSTDVLQAKGALARARARRVQAEGALINALNRYKAIFGRMPDNIQALKEAPYPAPFMAQSLTHALDIALEGNPTLKNAILAADIAKQDVKIARADNFFPKIDATAERKFKSNVGGTLGTEQETLAKVEMTFDFNLGFTAVNTLRASESDLSATTFTAADTRRQIEEAVRNSWQQLDTAQKTLAHLNYQAELEAAFLELARNERNLGRRSLIDVLQAEVDLINAKSDAISAETDVIVAAYGLLASTGQLEYEVIKQSKGIEPPRPVQETVPESSGAPVPDAAPRQGVTPAPKQEGRLPEDADTLVTEARSLADLRALLESETAAAPPAQTSAQRPATANKPPATPASVLAAVPVRAVERVEIASSGPPPSHGYQPIDGPSLPAAADTMVHSIPKEIAEARGRPSFVADAVVLRDIEVAETAFDIDDEPPAPIVINEKKVNSSKKPVEQASSVGNAREPAAEITHQSSAAGADGLNGTLSGIVAFLDQAHAAKLAADGKSQAVSAADEPIPAAPVEKSPPPVEPMVEDNVPVASADVRINPVSHLLRDVVALFEPQSAPPAEAATSDMPPSALETAVEPAPAAVEQQHSEDTETAALPAAGGPVPADRESTGEADAFASIVHFFESNSQGGFQRHDVGTDNDPDFLIARQVATVAPVSQPEPILQTTDPAQQIEADAASQDVPDFFGAIASLFDAETGVYQISVEVDDTDRDEVDFLGH